MKHDVQVWKRIADGQFFYLEVMDAMWDCVCLKGMNESFVIDFETLVTYFEKVSKPKLP